MKHYGDITKLSGYDLPIVDVITGGSPCQELSIAGQRAGLAGERSGLFMEQIRIVKEMREHDRATGRTGWMVRPRYMVWENVPGAFSCSGGKDFQAVLEEIVGIVEEHVPDLSEAVKGGWTKAGCIYDEMGAWSIAWRVHDTQFWGCAQYVDGRMLNRGTPQRRKRIALVADFGGLSAPEILFERKGVSGNLEPCGAEREKTSGEAGSRVACTITSAYGTKWNGNAGSFNGENFVYGDDETVYSLQGGSYTLNTIDRPAVLNSSGLHGGQRSKAGGIAYSEDVSPSLKSVPSGGNTVPDIMCVAVDVYNQTVTGDVAASVTAATGGANTSGPKLMCSAVNYRNGEENSCVNGTLQSKEQGYNMNSNNVIRVSSS